MNFSSVIEIIKKIKVVKNVFSDGRMLDDLQEDRTIQATPYIEIVQSNSDYSDSTSDSVTNHSTATARVVYKKEIDDIRSIKDAIQNEQRENRSDQLDFSYADTFSLNWALDVLPFQVSFFEVLNKTDSRIPVVCDLASWDDTAVWFDQCKWEE